VEDHRGPDRRASVLTDNDIQRFLAAVEAFAVSRFESIGYDITTPKSRAEINADHVFVRDLRQGTGRAKIAAIGVFFLFVLSIIGHTFIDGAIAALKATVGK